jgi:hypothetical protein
VVDRSLGAKSVTIFFMFILGESKALIGVEPRTLALLARGAGVFDPSGFSSGLSNGFSEGFSNCRGLSIALVNGSSTPAPIATAEMFPNDSLGFFWPLG